MTKSVFISYKQSSPTREIASDIARHLKSLGLRVTLDVHVLAHGDSISKFMETIKSHDHILSVISQDYLKSIACIYEQILVGQIVHEKTERFHIPLVLDDVTIFSPDGRSVLREYWRQKRNEISNSFVSDLVGNTDAKTLEQIDGSVENVFSSIESAIARLGDTMSLRHSDFQNDSQRFYRNIFRAIGEPFPNVYDLLLAAEMISDRAEQRRRFDELRAQFQDELLVPLFEAYLIMHDLELNPRPGEHEQAERLLNKVLSLKPDYAEALNNLSTLYLTYPQNFVEPFTNALRLLDSAITVAESDFQRALFLSNRALTLRKLWKQTNDVVQLFAANEDYRHAIILSPNNAKIRFDYYAFLHENLFQYPSLCTLEEWHAHLDSAISLDAEYLINECLRELSTESAESPNLFCRKIIARAYAELKDWIGASRYNEEVIQICRASHLDNSLFAEALSNKARAILETINNAEKVQLDEAEKLLLESIPLFEKYGETKASIVARRNLITLSLEYKNIEIEKNTILNLINEALNLATRENLREEESSCWFLRGRFAQLTGAAPLEVISFYQKGLSVIPEQNLALRADANTRIGQFYFAIASGGQFSYLLRAKDYFLTAVELQRVRNDVWEVGRALWNVGKTLEQLGACQRMHSDLVEATEYFTRAIDLMEQAGDLEGLSKCLHSRAILLKNMFWFQGGTDHSLLSEAKELMAKVIELNFKLNRSHEAEGYIHCTLAMIAHANGDFSEMLEEINKHVSYWQAKLAANGNAVARQKLAVARQNRQWLIRNSPLQVDRHLARIANEDREYYLKAGGM